LVPRYSVLIVDPLEETHEVLRSALEPRGVQVLATGEPAQGLAMARKHVPHLIVLDVERLAAASTDIADNFAAQSRARATPLLFLGGRGRRSDLLPPGEFVQKPYHYGPLIRKIEELLASYQQPVARAA
jgi:CheY-like chemotaxis protein